MFSLFKKRRTIGRNGKPTAVAFVDFEHWYISLDRNYNLRPDIREWRNELSKSYDIQEIIFFADFSNVSLKAEIPKIREITNYIIETQNVSQNFKKDFTDFIMLDHIYQKAMNSSDIDTFILFSGDGHFSSVVSFLTTQLNKRVVIYGIQNSVSHQLQNSASECIVLPHDTDMKQRYRSLILNNLSYLKKREEEGKLLNPTFGATVDAVARQNNIRPSEVGNVLRNMIEEGYINQTVKKLSSVRSVIRLDVDWEKCRRDGIYN